MLKRIAWDAHGLGETRTVIRCVSRSLEHSCRRDGRRAEVPFPRAAGAFKPVARRWNRISGMHVQTEGVGLAACVGRLYRAISGPAGERNWEIHSACFAPGARMCVLTQRGNAVTHESLTPDEYRRSRTPFFASNDFYEVETARQVQESGPVAHVLSAYECRRTPDGPAFASGVNSIQLIRLPTGWKILSILWEATPFAARLMDHVAAAKRR